MIKSKIKNQIANKDVEDKKKTLLALAYVECLWKLPSSNMKNKTPNILDLKFINKDNDFEITLNKV